VFDKADTPKIIFDLQNKFLVATSTIKVEIFSLETGKHAYSYKIDLFMHESIKGIKFRSQSHDKFSCALACKNSRKKQICVIDISQALIDEKNEAPEIFCLNF
jgi:hypothetical protein